MRTAALDYVWPMRSASLGVGPGISIFISWPKVTLINNQVWNPLHWTRCFHHHHHHHLGSAAALYVGSNIRVTHCVEILKWPLPQAFLLLKNQTPTSQPAQNLKAACDSHPYLEVGYFQFQGILCLFSPNSSFCAY